MHVLFVHQNFPAQFGHIASHLVKNHGFRCTFVSERPAGTNGGVERIQYKTRGGAVKENSYFSRTFENAVWHADAVYQALEKRPDIKPDLVVAHSGFGSSIFLRDLYDCRIINYFEYFYRSKNSDLDFRPDFPTLKANSLRSRTRNAMILLDMNNCDIGYCPTEYQKAQLPAEYQFKIRTIFDGIDVNFWRRIDRPIRQFGTVTIPDHVKIVSYCSRGMESMRGFDIFMKAANVVAKRRRDCVFVVAGEDRICYGGDQRVTGSPSFKEWVLKQDHYDPERFVFIGRVPPDHLVRLFSATSVHVYLTVPFVLSWSMMDALSCGAVVLGSDTAPVREMIEPGVTGLLNNFFDVEGFANQIERVLDAPGDYRKLGDAGTALIREKYSLDRCLPKMLELYRGSGPVD